MKLLLDTHLLLWAANEPQRLSAKALALLSDSENELMFSAASLWEIAIKNGLGRADFVVDTRLLRRGLLDNQYGELAITSAHAIFGRHRQGRRPNRPASNGSDSEGLDRKSVV